MDSLTHLSVAAAIAPPQHRHAALLVGAALHSLPDLDVLPLLRSDDPVVRMTWHGGATRSLLVLPFVAFGSWTWFKRRGGGDKLVRSDLRMGSEPDCSFRFAVAAHVSNGGASGWRDIPPRQLRFEWRSRRDLTSLWRRIWQAPVATAPMPATQTSG